MKMMTAIDSFAQVKKHLLKQFKTFLATLDVESDFIEISVQHEGANFQFRLCGTIGPSGSPAWDVVRVVNQSIIPLSNSRRLVSL